MRIALIVPGFSADEEDWCIPALLNFVRALAQRVELEVFTLRYPHRRGQYQVGNARVHSFGYATRRGPASLALWREAARHIQEQHARKAFDVLHAFWADEPGWVGATVAARGRVPLVVSLAGGELANLPSIGYGLQRHWLPRLLMRRALARADCITAGSSSLRELAYQDGLRQVQWAPLGVDTKRFYPNLQPPTPALSAVEGSNLQLLNVGSLAPVKNQRLLVEATREVVAALPGTRLRIVGDGESKAVLRRAIGRVGLGSHVELMGALPHDHLPDVYRAADLYVQASLHEAQGMAVLEAASCGVPSVGTAVGALCDLAGSQTRPGSRVGALAPEAA
ncbi:MAG TPA: glycosyltransferase, partial [Chloroflexota bacterium]|nr:glycosyltransferase [Chloroflexota bacterium]